MKNLRAVLAVSAFGVALLVSPTGAQAATVSQWASSASAENIYDETYSASQAAGAPNATGCDNINQVWATLKRSDIASITLTYAKSVSPTQIKIYQNNVQGAVANVEVSSNGVNWTSVYTGDPTKADSGTCSDASTNFNDVLTVSVTSSASKLINKVRVTIDQTTAGWAEIDAVQLVGNKGKQSINLVAKTLKVANSLSLPSKTSANLKVTWTTSTKKVCSISSGKLKALKKGTCKIVGKNTGDGTYDSVSVAKSIVIK